MPPLVRLRGALALLALLPAAVTSVPAQQPVFRSGTQTVPVYVTVLGTDGRLVTDLTRDDFEVLDNGRPQPITLFDAGTQPINIIVMLDMSGSMIGNISVLRRAAVEMFTRLEPADQARVGNFGDRILISPTFTNNLDELIRTVWLDLEPGGATPLWGAVNAAMAGLSSVEGRRVVLVLSDGKNTGLRSVNGITSGPSLDDVIERAQTDDYMVYAIGLASRGAAPGGGRGGQTPGPVRRGGTVPRGPLGGGPFGGFGWADEPDPGLRELAAESGGGYFELEDTENLGPAFARVADELHRQYLLGFAAPEADGRLHALEVRLKDASMTPRARRSYQAPRQNQQ
jgi:Ca-activated chloride channel family protein